MTLFAFFGIWWATAAFGVGAVAIPVVIHLINRRRFKIVPWAAMKFLLAAQKQTRKRMRIEQLLLLLCRMAILALLVFAMASVMSYAEQVWSHPAARTIWSVLGLDEAGIGPKTRSQRIHHVFVLDASLSTNQKVNGEQTAFDIARQLAIKKINDNSSGDGYSVLVLKDTPTWLIGEPSQDARKVIKEIEAVKPSHGNASVPVALSMVAAKLGDARGRFHVQAVYFFTDMQRSTWLPSATQTSGAKGDDPGRDQNPYMQIQDLKATTVFVDCGPTKDAANLAVTEMGFDVNYTPYVTTGMDLTLNATVENFSPETKREVRAEVLIGKARENANEQPMQLRVIDQDSKSIDGNAKQTFRFSKVRFPAPGTYAVQVKIGDDPLDQDNTRTIVITVRDTIPILLVNGKASADRFERATEYLKLALNPFPAGVEPKGFPLRPKVVSSSQFSDLTEAELETYDCIFWCDVGQFGVNDVRKIDAHLRRGGGFVVTLGPKAAESLERYNDLLYKDDQGFLPAKLMKVVTAPKEHHFYLQNTDESAFERPPLAAFKADEDRLTLRTARFRQFVFSTIPEGKARTVLSFMPEVVNGEKVKRNDTLPVNAPAIVEWNPPLGNRQQAAPAKPGARQQPMRYRGKVVLCTSSVNMDWTSWPGSPSYGAMMHELTRLATDGRLREQSQIVGGQLEAYLPGGAESDVTLHYPAGLVGMKPEKKRTQMIDEVNLFRWADTNFSGVYRVVTSTGQEIPFAVNVPVSAADLRGTESDLSRLDEVKLAESYPGWKMQVVRNPLDALVTGEAANPDPTLVDAPMGPKLANIALLLVLLLMFAEIVLAWLFGHYTTTEGSLVSQPAGPISTAVAAGIAILSTIVFAVGAYVIVDYAISGDFLHFLPDIVRTLVEQFVGAQPLQAGEGASWKFETMPFLLGLPGSERWYQVLLTIGVAILIFFTYKAEAPRVSIIYKLLLGALRLYLIVFTLWFILPRPQIHYDREGWPDTVLLIDDTRSMGEPDTYQTQLVIERVKRLSDGIREKLHKELPQRIAVLKAQIDAKKTAADTDADARAEVESLSLRMNYWIKQQDNLAASKWRPSRLQLVQAILAQPEPHWLKTLLTKQRTKVHVFHLDAQGRATKLRDGHGDAGEIIDPNDVKTIDRTEKAIANLEPVGNDSRLGTALKQVIDHYRGSGLASVIMFTDGVTTRDETIAQAAAYAKQKEVALFLIGVGDENEQHELKLHDLVVEDEIYVGDNAIFEVRVTGKGFKDLTVRVVLKYKDKDGKEREIKAEMIKVDPAGKSVKVRFKDQPKVVGSKHYIIEVEAPKLEPGEKPIPPEYLRVERTIKVVDMKQINVLYVEGQPRYEFRFLKYLMEREAVDDKKKKKSIELTVLLLDADIDWAAKGRKGGVDVTAIADFPPTLEALNKYDVLIIGDCDPNHKKLQNRLKDIAAFARGEDEKGKKATKPGGGVLFIAGAFHNPHKYRGTPLGDVMPVEPLIDKAPPDVARPDRYRPDLTPAGRLHPIFRFSPDEGINLGIWKNLQGMYWYSTRYKVKPAAEVLAVHPTEKAAAIDPSNPDGKHPLVVQQFVGTGRSMFFGFDETWRWRLREDEAKFNNFWIQTMRYLSRGRSTRTDLKLDKQTPYKLGEPIEITVRFPDSAPGGANQPGPRINDKTEVKVRVDYMPPDAKDGARAPESHSIQLEKVANSWGTFKGVWNRTRDGKYRFRLTDPDVSESQPDKEKPSAEAIVELPPGELDPARLRMNYEELMEAAAATQGEFYTLATADQVLDKLPPSYRIALSSNMPPTLLWNQWWVFALVLFLITSEWILRKLKHLL